MYLSIRDSFDLLNNFPQSYLAVGIGHHHCVQILRVSWHQYHTVFTANHLRIGSPTVLTSKNIGPLKIQCDDESYKYEIKYRTCKNANIL